MTTHVYTDMVHLITFIERLGSLMKRTNDLGNDSIVKLVLRLAIPTMFAQLVNVLYSIVDRMFIGAFVGDLALAGAGVCGPIVTFLASFATLIGLGGSPIMAMRMGEGNRKEASKILSNSFYMLSSLAVILTTIFLLTKGSLLFLFGASDTTFPYANTYLTIYTLGTFFALMSTGMNSFLICQGFSGLGMLTVMLGAILNIALDPLFIYVFDMGVAGAAFATVISQAASCCFVLLSLRSKRMPIRLGIEAFSGQIIKRILLFGLSPFLIIASDSVILLVLNAMLQKYGGPNEGDILVTCATIVQSYYLIISMPMGGLTLGSQPVISFNYGAGNRKRIMKAIAMVVGLCLIFCVIMTIVTHVFSPLFVRLFTPNPIIIERSVSYIKLFTCMIIPLAVQYALVDETTAVGEVRLALFCSMFRKFSFLGLVIFLPRFFGAPAVFYSEPIVDVCAAILTTTLFFTFIPKYLKKRESVLNNSQ